ncbi:DUF805 domain-containing protein [Brevundimonas sp.]|uniref:DUF805 domain-containing protein n=1 Tax=Brevundimonas sp. TaxID=1871086 RepID=UPI0025C049EF|nr:DUF805 domain-containing protein [Brevundimonas sp.]
MVMFRPLIRYADFKGRASRSEYWLFAVLQGLWYGLLVGLTLGAMGSGEPAQATPGVLIAFGVILISLAALIVPNYAVLVRRLHDSGRGAIWLCLIVPSLLSSVMVIGTIATAVGAVGAGASREAFVGTVLTGLGAAGVLSVIGMVCQGVLLILTLLPGTRGENQFGGDPRDPSSRGYSSGGGIYDEARLESLFAEARGETGAEPAYKPRFDFGPGPQTEPAPTRQAAPVDWGRPAYDPGTAPSQPFGRRNG